MGEICNVIDQAHAKAKDEGGQGKTGQDRAGSNRARWSVRLRAKLNNAPDQCSKVRRFGCPISSLFWRGFVWPADLAIAGWSVSSLLIDSLAGQVRVGACVVSR